MDLLKDLANALRGQLMEQGYDVSHVQDDDHRTLMLYSRVRRYSIEQGPRDIRKSTNFECPPQYVLGLQRLEQAIQAGQNLTQYRSKGIERGKSLDGLLDYWQIHHFHLGTNLEEDGFVERTGGLLFCVFDEGSAYFIKVGTHDPLQWTEKQLVEIIHRDWPELLDHCRLDSMTLLARSIDSEALKKIRKANGTTLLEMEDGTVYFEPGWGRTTGGLHINDLRWADHISHFVESIESQIVNNWTLIVDCAKTQGYHLKGTEQLTLIRFDFNRFWDIHDTESGYWFRQYVKP